MSNPSRLITEIRHPEPIENLVESMPVKDGIKLSKNHSFIQRNNGMSWSDLRGLGWMIYEDWS